MAQNYPQSLYPEATPQAAATGMPPYSRKPNDPAETKAEGGLGSAWLGTALHPARRVIAAWSAQAETKKGWVRGSLFMGVVISAIGAAIGGVILYSTNTEVPRSTGITIGGAVQYHSYPLAEIFTNLVQTPISYLAATFAIAFALALIMPGSYGSMNERYQRVLKPLALVSVGAQIVAALYTVVGALLLMAFSSKLQALTTAATQKPVNTTVVTNALGAIVPYYGFAGLALVIYGVYSLILYVQSGAVGSNQNRWAVFGMSLAAAIVVGIITSILYTPLNLIASS